MANPKARIKYFDPLRAFLALSVVIYHIPQISETVGIPFFNNLALFHRGSEAVLVFFALSGYLIIGQLFKEKSTRGTINIKDFYVRRMLRLYPVYYLVVFLRN